MKRFALEHKLVSALMLLGVLVVIYRLFSGLGAVSALSDSQPWGLIKSLDIMALAALAAGATTVAAMVHVFGMRRFKPLVRPALLMGFVAHSFVLMALLYDVGSPIDIWRIVIHPNVRSVMFLAFLCELVYTAALVSETFSEFVGPGRYEGAARLIRSMQGLLVVVSATMSVIYQSTLGALYLVSPHRVGHLWYTDWLPVLFFLSAVAAGLGMVVVEAYMSDKAGRRPFDAALMGEVGLVMSLFLWLYVLLRLADFSLRGGFSQAGGDGLETGWFLVETCAGFILPAMMLIFKKVRENPAGLMMASVLVGLGVVMNRFGVVIIGWGNMPGVRYFPSGIEVYASFFFILAPVAIYSYLSKRPTLNQKGLQF